MAQDRGIWPHLHMEQAEVARLAKEEQVRVDHVTDTGGDWEGYYIDGQLRLEGHSVDTRLLLTELGFNVGTVEIDFEKVTELAGRCPLTFIEAMQISRTTKEETP